MVVKTGDCTITTRPCARASGARTAKARIPSTPTTRCGAIRMTDLLLRLEGAPTTPGEPLSQTRTPFASRKSLPGFRDRESDRPAGRGIHQPSGRQDLLRREGGFPQIPIREF